MLFVHLSCAEHSPSLGQTMLAFFPKRVGIFNQFFTHILYVHIYARLQIVIELSPNLMKLCHIMCDYLVHIICSKCPPPAETHAFRRLRKSLIALLIVVCGKSSQICCGVLFSRPYYWYAVASVVVCLSVTLCIVAKRCVLEQKLLWRAYRKSYMRNRLVPK